MEVDGVYLDPASIEVLRRLRDAPAHRSNTSEMKDHLDAYGLGNRESVKYRFRKLEDAGLVEVSDPGLDDRGRRLPLRVELTEQGRDLVDGLDLDPEAPEDDVDAEQVAEAVRDLEERVEDIEDDLRKFRETYTRQMRGEGDYYGVLPAVQELEERVDRIETGITETLGEWATRRNDETE